MFISPRLRWSLLTLVLGLLFVPYVYLATFLFSVVCLGVGYLPYSDRPGPGWTGVANTHHWEHVVFLWEWVEYVLPYAITLVPIAVIFAILVRLLALTRTPRLLVRAIGALPSAAYCLLLLAAAGWYISLGAVPTVAGACLAGVYGGWVLPWYGPRGRGTGLANRSLKLSFGHLRWPPAA